MALSESEQLRGYPLPAYNFRVTVGGKTVNFTKVSGLEREHETVTYRHGMSWREGEQIVKFHVDRYKSVVLERGSLPGGDGTTWLYRWLEDQQPRSMAIDMCDARGDVVIRWKIAKALATKLQGPTLDASASDVAIETLELMARGITLGREA